MHNINSLSNSSTEGLDEIKAEPIKAVASLIALPLPHVCNCVLQDGRLPDELKIARVSVVLKGGAKNGFINCRPISVLGIFSIVIERVTYCWLHVWVVKFKLISFIIPVSIPNEQINGINTFVCKRNTYRKYWTKIANNWNIPRYKESLWFSETSYLTK